jgi:hypothetical protein
MVLAVGLNIHTAIFMKKVYGKNRLALTKYEAYSESKYR